MRMGTREKGTSTTGAEPKDQGRMPGAGDARPEWQGRTGDGMKVGGKVGRGGCPQREERCCPLEP